MSLRTLKTRGGRIASAISHAEFYKINKKLGTASTARRWTRTGGRGHDVIAQQVELPRDSPVTAPDSALPLVDLESRWCAECPRVVVRYVSPTSTDVEK